MKPVCYCDSPHTFLGRPVVVRVVGRLNLARIFSYVSPTHGFRENTREKRALEHILRTQVNGYLSPQDGSKSQHFPLGLAKLALGKLSFNFGYPEKIWIW